MYYRIINTLDRNPYSSGYNSTSIKELAECIYDLLWDEYFDYDLDFVEGKEHNFKTIEDKLNRIKQNIKEYNSVWVLDIEKRKYPFKYSDLIHRYWDKAYYKWWDKQMGYRFKKHFIK